MPNLHFIEPLFLVLGIQLSDYQFSLSNLKAKYVWGTDSRGSSKCSPVARRIRLAIGGCLLDLLELVPRINVFKIRWYYRVTNSIAPVHITLLWFSAFVSFELSWFQLPIATTKWFCEICSIETIMDFRTSPFTNFLRFTSFSFGYYFWGVRFAMI